MKHTTTKRALLLSLGTLMLCMAMLIGSTFAWFTDSISTGINEIRSGNLDVGLEYKNNEVVNWTTVDKDTLVFGDTLWEPGHVEIAYFKVKNLGTLALEYSLGITIADEEGSTNVNDEDFKLSNYLKFAVIEGEQTYTTRNEAIAAAEANNPVTLSAYVNDKTTVLYPVSDPVNAAEPSEAYVAFVVYMPTTVSNEANYKTGAAAPRIQLGVTLDATQTPYEYDSFDNQYDDLAAALILDGYKEVATTEDLEAALAAGDNVVLSKDIKITTSNALAAGQVIEANGHTITITDLNNLAGDGAVIRNATIAADGTWGMFAYGGTYENCTFDKCSPYFAPKENSSLTFRNCVFDNTTLQICYNEGGRKPETNNVTITGCTFNLNNTDEASHAIVFSGGTKTYWSTASNIVMEDNTFNPTHTEDTYIAYYIYGDSANSLTSAPKFLNNTFNGSADCALNSPQPAEGKRIPLNRAGDLVVDVANESIWIGSAEGLMGLYDEYKTLSGLGGDRHYQVYITKDIDMTGKEWTPFTYKNTVAIDFNGQGHTISNLNCGMDANGRSGFIGWFGWGTIKDLAFENVTAAGTQAGIIAGNGEGWKLENVTIKGNNTISYQRDASLSYQEEWNAVGAVFGYNNQDEISGSSITIAEGATIALNYNTIEETKAIYVNELAYGGTDISGIVVNNGTITTSGTHPEN